MHRRAFPALLLLSTVGSALAETPGQPKAFKLTMGGFFGPRFEVRLLDSKLYYSESQRRYGDRDFKTVRSATFRPTAKQWASLRQVLDRQDAWNWQAAYEPPIAEADGTKWTLQIIYTDRKVVSQGDNKYPGSTGTTGGSGGWDHRPTPAFQSFLNVVRSLVGDLPIW